MSSVTLAAPQSGDTFGIDETILAFVGFDEAVTGAPQLALSICTYTRQAAYGGRSTPPRCSFVHATDSDMDGLSIGASALPLNGGTIQDVNGNAATLNLSGYTVSDAASHKVDGRVSASATVRLDVPEGKTG